MSQQPCERIFLRDGQRLLCWQACDRWDRTTMLACLSSDPRSMDDLAVAWARYRPDQPLMELEWFPADAPPDGGEWMAVDLTAQRFAWCDPEDIAGEPGSYEPDDEDVEGRNSLAWINVPPWWTKVPAERWSFADPQPAETGDPGEATSQWHTAEREARRPLLDFRSVLYGGPLLQYIAEQALGAWTKARNSELAKRHSKQGRPSGSPSEAEQRAHGRDGLSAEERAQVQRWEKTTKQIHARWLMTPREELGGQPPRAFLHLDRQWKDRELAHRRSQWALERRPPPPAPRSSAVFLYGPMGIEEVTSYFDLCRQVIRTALRLVDDQPRIPLSQLIERLEAVFQECLASAAIEGERPTLQEVIDSERQLMPRVANSDPTDCDCPLCRMSGLEPDVFGPAFYMCDTYIEEMEEEFAFSLQETKEDWKKGREEWLGWFDSTSSENAASDEDEEGEEDDDGDNEHAGDVSGTSSSAIDASSGQWPKVWHSSYNDMSHGNPSLSLLGIGAHLAEIIDELKRIGAAREEIDRLNLAFDRLARSIRRWLTREATAANPEDHECIEPAAGEMTELLEAMALQHPELTARSADLQSQIHQWQRQLAPLQDG